jgi:hypothetical protein
VNEKPASLRDVNLQLKNGKADAPVFDVPADKPVFASGQQQKMKPIFATKDYRPRTHIRAQFFITESNKEPTLLFNALVLEIPYVGQLFKIETQVYEVRGVTRNMEFVGLDGNIAKEFTPSVLVAPFIPRR